MQLITHRYIYLEEQFGNTRMLYLISSYLLFLYPMFVLRSFLDSSHLGSGMADPRETKIILRARSSAMRCAWTQWARMPAPCPECQVRITMKARMD